MFGILDDPHRRHFALTLLVAVGLLAYVTESITVVPIPGDPDAPGFDLAMLLALVGGFRIYTGALAALVRGRLTADLAVSLAAFAALYLGYTGEGGENMYLVAAEVIFIMLIGESLEHFAVDRTRSGIATLLALRPETARVRRKHHHHHEEDHHHHDDDHDGHDHELVIQADQIRYDDVVLVRPGDRIPVDGRVLSGHSSVDQGPITGESLPADKTPGDEVFAGTINLYGAMELIVERLGRDTTLEQIIHLVEEAEAAKAPTQRLADRYATWFVPIVLAVAAATYLFTGDTWFSSGNLVRAVAVLVVACPCALVLATPTAIAAGIGSLVGRGILVKGGVALERLARLRAVAFDKTGTLTLARLRIADMVAAPGCDKDELLRLAAAVEAQSEHPVGRLIAAEAAERQLPAAEAERFTAHPGLGAEAQIEDATVRVGSPRFLAACDIAPTEEFAARVEQLAATGATVVLAARDDEVIGAVAVEDTVRPEARSAIHALREQGIHRLVMLTGDNPQAATTVADALGIDDVQAGLLPADKVEAIRRLQLEAAPLAMVGDGINDAPSLVTADVGVAMADIGTHVAIASADVVLVGDDLGKLAVAVDGSRRMLAIIWQNIIGFALVLNVLAVAAASLGWLGPVAAAVLHQVGSLAVVLNSMRLLVDTERWRRRLVRGRRWLRRRRAVLAGAAAAVILAAYAATGCYLVRVGEVAVVRQFGRVVDAAQRAGLHYRLPYPFGSHRLLRPGQVRRVEVGFRTTSDPTAEPPAYEWNVQHRGEGYERYSDESTVWTGDGNLADVNLVVHYRTADPLAALCVVGDTLPDGSNKWDVLVRDVAESALRTEMAGRAAEEVLSTHRSAIEMAVRSRAEEVLARYGSGFTIVDVLLGDVHPPLEVVESYREVAQAQEDKEARINLAESYQFETEARTRGRVDQQLRTAETLAARLVAVAGARAEAFLATEAAYAAAPEVTRLRMYLDTIEQVFSGRQKIIVDRASGPGRRRVFLGRQGLWSMAPAEAEPIPATEGNETR